MQSITLDTDSYEHCLPCAVSSGRKSGLLQSMCAQTAPVLLLTHLFIPGIIARRSNSSYESVSTLLGREIAASEINEVEHVTCDCCHRHGKTLRYSFNHTQAWGCISCNKRLRAFLNGQPKTIKTATPH